MPVVTASLNKKLYDLLKVRGYDPIPKDSTGQTTPVPDDSDVFKFTFKKGGEAIGDVWITIDSSQNLVVYYDDAVSDSDEENTASGSQTDTWMGLLQHLKSWAQRRQLSFELKNKNHLTGDMAQRAHMKKQEQIEESKKVASKKKDPYGFDDDGKRGKGPTGKTRTAKAAADKKKVDEGMGLDGADPYTLGAPIDKKHVYQVHRTNNPGKFVHDGGTTHSLDDAKRRKAFLLKTAPPGVKGKIVKVPRQSLAGPKGMLPEGYYPMGKKASYSDAVPQVKIVLQHTRQVEEGEQRFRNVAKIFLENEAGERILAPTTRPGIARIYARHLAEGGLPHDDRWNHVGALVEEYTKMAGFVRATRNGQFNESAQALVEKGIAHYQALRESLGKMTGHRGYNAYFESWAPPLMEDDGDTSNLSELFVQENLDPRIESVMPILSRLHKPITEMSEVTELAEWADNITEVTEDGADTKQAQARRKYEDDKKNRDVPGYGTAAWKADQKRKKKVYGKVTEEESLTSNNPQGIPEAREDYVVRSKREDQEGRKEEARQIKAELVKNPSGPDSGWMKNRLSQLLKDIAKNKEFNEDEDSESRCQELSHLKHDSVAMRDPQLRSEVLRKEVELGCGTDEQIDEGRMAEADMVMQDLINGEREIYDVMNHPQGPEEEYVAQILQDLYHEVAIERHFHEDDDFEKIEQFMMYELEKKYGHPDSEFDDKAVANHLGTNEDMYESEDSDDKDDKDEPKDPTDHKGKKRDPDEDSDTDDMNESLAHIKRLSGL